MRTPKRMTLTIPNQHKWLVSLKSKSILIECLLDEFFGDDYSLNEPKNLEIQARKYIKAQNMIEKALHRKNKKNDGSGT